MSSYNWSHQFIERRNKKENEKALLKQLHAGSVKIVMHGKKLKGEFALVKMKNTDDNSWLLIKHKDDFAESPYDAEENTSSKSLVTKFLEEKKSLKIKEKKKS